jgi:hypothetical protein
MNMNEMLDLIYNYVYNNKNKEKYYYERLNIENINIQDLIKCEDFNYCEILKNYGDKENYKLINHGNDKVIFKKYFKNYPVTLVCQKHKLKNSVSIIDINYELMMNQIISEYIISDDIPFYLINICNFNIQINDKCIVNNALFNTTLLNKLNIYDNDKPELCISVYEHYNSYTTFAKIMQEKLSDKDISDLIFQVLFSFAYINYKLINFRHNDFNIDSFLLIKNNKNNKIELKMGDIEYELKNSKYLCKLFNYRKSTFELLKNNHECMSNNPSYDIYTFFKSLYNCSLKTPNFDNIKIIINNFIPTDLLVKNLDENKFSIEYSEIIIPQQLLSKNNFFSDYIMGKKFYIHKGGKGKKYNSDELETEEVEEINENEPSDAESEEYTDSDYEEEEDEDDYNSDEDDSQSDEDDESDESDESDKETNKKNKKVKNKKLFIEEEEKVENENLKYKNMNEVTIQQDNENLDFLTEGDANPAGYKDEGLSNNTKKSESQLRKEIAGLKRQIKINKKNSNNNSKSSKSKIKEISNLFRKNKHSNNDDEHGTTSFSMNNANSHTKKPLKQENKFAKQENKQNKSDDISETRKQFQNILNDLDSDALIPLPVEMQQMYKTDGNNNQNSMDMGMQMQQNPMDMGMQMQQNPMNQMGQMPSNPMNQMPPNPMMNQMPMQSEGSMPKNIFGDTIGQHNKQQLPMHNLPQNALANAMNQAPSSMMGQMPSSMMGGGKKPNKLFFLRKKN